MASAHDRCPTCGFDPATVSPGDAAVAARSLPRRFRAVFARPDDDDVEVPAEAVAEAAAAADALHEAAEALGRRPVAPGPSGPALDAVLARIEAAALALAHAIERTPSDEWATSSALPTARAGVHAGVHHLRAAQRVS
ncbi:MAG TPA: hypothetical protein VHF47_10845 [Acidimicrobiales bacterium]|nr:hypothetical protein [Acidimicrobiales bacterium]